MSVFDQVEQSLISWQADGVGRSWKIIRTRGRWTVSLWQVGMTKAVKCGGVDLDAAALKALQEFERA